MTSSFTDFPSDTSLWVGDLLTVAEKTHYQATSRYPDVMAFLAELKAQSRFMTLHRFGSSAEDRDLMMAIFAKPQIFHPWQALQSDKPVVLLQNNIHAGEVCPKEASMILMRELALGRLQPLLDDLIILVVPLYNADGNERFSPGNRLSQIGPDGGVGIRTNALNQDLNRDYMKMEAPETLHLIRDLYVTWQPDVIIDGHTTDGSRHGYDLTYGFPHHPNASSHLIDYIRDVMLPCVSAQIKQDTDIDMFYYGDFIDFRDPAAGWSTYSHHARYGAAYGGLQNRLAILMETYSYVSFEQRVKAAYHFMRETLAYTAHHRQEVKALVKQAQLDTITAGETYDPEHNLIGIDIEKKAFAQPVTVIGYRVDTRNQTDGSVTATPTLEKTLYTAPYFGKFVAVRSVPRPLAYLIPRAEKRLIVKLQQHGIAVETLLRPCTAQVETFQVLSVKADDQCFQGHREVNVTVERIEIQKTFEVGDFVIPMNQPAGHVLAGLLEPDSDDSLAHWNYFDRYLTGKIRWDKDFVTEYEYNLVDLPRTREIYDHLIDKNPSLSGSQKQAMKEQFFEEAVGFYNEMVNHIPVFRLIQQTAYCALLYTA